MNVSASRPIGAAGVRMLGRADRRFVRVCAGRWARQNWRVLPPRRVVVSRHARASLASAALPAGTRRPNPHVVSSRPPSPSTMSITARTASSMPLLRRHQWCETSPALSGMRSPSVSLFFTRCELSDSIGSVVSRSHFQTEDVNMTPGRMLQKGKEIGGNAVLLTCDIPAFVLSVGRGRRAQSGPEVDPLSLSSSVRTKSVG